MKRIAVVGCPGAGKTTFVKKLAQITGLPVIHLDFYYHQKEYNYYIDQKAWEKKVKQLAARERWITDGNYKSTFSVRFKRADTIIFLDYPRRTLLYGIFKRRIENQGKLRSDMPPEWKEHINWYFLKYVWKFRGEARSQLLQNLKKYKDKDVRVFTSRKQAKRYLASL